MTLLLPEEVNLSRRWHVYAPRNTVKLPFWPEPLIFAKPSNTAIFAKAFLALTSLLGLAAFIPLGSTNWIGAGTPLISVIMGISGIVGVPRRYYVFGVALINLQLGLYLWAWRPDIDVHTALSVSIILFFAGLYGLLWWVAAEPVWRWRAPQQQKDAEFPCPPVDEAIIPPPRVQVEVIVARILITLFTLAVSMLVIAAAWFITLFGETQGMSEPEAIRFVIIALAYPLFIWITAHFRLPKRFRVVVLWLHVLLTLGIAGWILWLNRESNSSEMGPVIGGISCSGLYALIWWVATQPKARTLPLPSPG